MIALARNFRHGVDSPRTFLGRTPFQVRPGILTKLKGRYRRFLRNSGRVLRAYPRWLIYSAVHMWRKKTAAVLTRPVKFSGKTLWLRNGAVELDHPIVDAFQTGAIVIVQFDQDCGLDRSFNNVIGLDLFGHKLWTAELPAGTLVSSDVYVSPAHLRRPVQFVSFSSYICTLDRRTGKILSTEFTK